MADWSHMHTNILTEIAARLQHYHDYTSFRRVCKCWHSAAREHNFKLNNPMPFLLLPPRISKTRHNIRQFFIKPVTYHHVLPKPANSEKRCFSSKGWIITVTPKLNLNVTHPFTGLQIRFPDIRWIRWSWRMYDKIIQKAVLSDQSNCAVMIIYGDKSSLAYARAGARDWVAVDTWNGAYFDVVFYQGKFYAINCHCEIVTCDVSDDKSPTLATFFTRLDVNLAVKKVYLVECLGRLLVVIRNVRLRDYEKQVYGTSRFHVFGLDLKTMEWEKVESLGSRSLFLGFNSSVSMESNGLNFKPNCIYFTDDYCCGAHWIKGTEGKDIGVYSLEDRSIKPYFYCEPYKSLSPPPLWVEHS